MRTTEKSNIPIQSNILWKCRGDSLTMGVPARTVKSPHLVPATLAARARQAADRQRQTRGIA